jgi:tryptophan-rich sensory protein
VSNLIARRVLPVLAAAVAAMTTAVLGILMTDLGDWYQSLEVPWWKPPDAIFGPAWGIIFSLAALAGLFAWHSSRSFAFRKRLIELFMLNGLLNALWSALFFRLQRPDLAAIEVIFLWLSIVWLIVHVRGVSRPAARLLLVYLAWVTFAGALTWSVAGLNGPFA